MKRFMQAMLVLSCLSCTIAAGAIIIAALATDTAQAGSRDP
jgi:hypothetical protein